LNTYIKNRAKEINKLRGNKYLSETTNTIGKNLNKRHSNSQGKLN
jgi:hypothetical protein